MKNIFSRVKTNRMTTMIFVRLQRFLYVFIPVIVFLISVIIVCKAEEKIFIDVMIKEAKENNPEIKMLQEKYLATKQKIITAKTWEYPLFGFETRSMERMYSVSQMLPFPGKLSLRGKVADNESNISEQELYSKIIQVVSMVKKSFWIYWLTDKTIEIYLENIDLMKGFLNIARIQYTVGKVTQIDVLKANTELAEMENMLFILQAEKISVQAELNALLNRPPETPLGKPEQPEQKKMKYNSYEETENLALKNRPEIKSKEFLYQRNISALGLSKREWYPDVMSGIKIDGMSNKTFMTQIAVPLYYKRQSSIIEAMKKEKEMAGWELETTKVTTLKELKDLWSKYNSRMESIQIYGTSIVPLAKQTLEITEIGYRAGKNDFLDLLDSQKRYLEYNIDYYRYLSEKEIFLAELERVTGVGLEVKE